MKKQPETLNEVIERLNDLSGEDKEILHTIADELLLDALSLSGCEDVVKAYVFARDRVGFWYA